MPRLSKPSVLAVALAATAVLVALIVFLPLGEWTQAVLAWTAGRGAWTAVILILLWIPAAVLFVPGSLVTLGTGFLLGVARGTVAVSIGSTLGAVAAFWIGRTLARDRVGRWVEDRPRFRAVDDAVGREGFRIVLLTRLSPLFPYNFLNYAYGVTAVSFREFLAGSWIGMLPGTILYVYVGSGARNLAGAATGSGERSTAELALFAAGLAATIVVAYLITRRARRALAGRIDADPE